LQLLRRNSSKLSIAKIESVSLSHTNNNKKDHDSSSSSATIFGVDLDKVTNSLLQPATNKMRRLRRRPTEDEETMNDHNNTNKNWKKDLLVVHSHENISSSLHDTDLHDFMTRDQYLGRRRRSNTLPESIGGGSVLPKLSTTMESTSETTIPTVKIEAPPRSALVSPPEKIKHINFNTERNKSKSCKKLRELVGKVLRKNLEHCHYDARLSRKRCIHLSQILEQTLKLSLNSSGADYKVVALVYIGELREDGMKQSCQYVWNPSTDFFVMETHRGEDMFATGVIFATLIETNQKSDPIMLPSCAAKSSEDGSERMV